MATLDFLSNITRIPDWNTSRSPEEVLDCPAALVVDGKCQADESKGVEFYVIYYTILFIIGIVSCVGNILILAVMARSPKIRSPSNYFIISLAVSDLVQAMWFPVYNVSHLQYPEILNTLGLWPSCSTVLVVLCTGQMASSNALVGITVTRFIAVKQPLNCQDYFTRCRMAAGVGFVWLCAFSVACSLYVRWPEPEQYALICRYELVFGIEEISCFMIFTVVAPMSLMVIFYICIVVTYRRQMANIANMNTVSSDKLKDGGQDDGKRDDKFLQRRLQQERKMIVMATILLAYFTCSWMPFVSFAYRTIACGCHTSDYIRATVRLLLFTNAGVNFCVYSLRFPEFKRQLLKMLSCCRCKQDDDRFATPSALSDTSKTNSSSSSLSTIKPQV